MLPKRIAYYTKKVAQFGAIHPSKHRNPYRHNRLMLYKKLMHEQIAKEGWKVN
ncbi:hypothetical protein J18TS1_12060 [Oceanobacillus oncorhynchi subsp. incaldanensis]|uniref:hypothetical protein n=1 Tax=Oceanobacillus oncorhynchi TaxID=545501 RepID=UPI001B077723|nr:hypothetical protein [Oceanobacillus oncorhynchi]GIO18106.1 hypothetical protein J18TS1_12060 [Oceanobacillus oncorhynchi subsp. incaldanensis]